MSKLSVQFQKLPGWAAQVVTDGYVKVIDPPFVNPFGANVKVVGRSFIPDGETNALIQQGRAGARLWFNRIAPTLLARPYVWAWEGPNEPQPVANWDFCNRLAEFTDEAASLFHGIGRKFIGGNLSEGNPGAVTDTERANLFCAIAQGFSNCDFWGYHCYWTPQTEHKESGYTQWHARSDKLMADYAAARGIKLPPRFITECGHDGQIIGRRANVAGWRALGETWADYKADLQRFATDIADEPEVVATFVFVAGANPDWLSFDLGEAETREVQTLETPAQPTQPAPTPQAVIVAPYALARPLKGGTVSQWWGVNKAAYADIPGLTEGHNGIDYAAPKGTPVLAAHDGTAYRGLDPTGFGQYVKVMGQGHYTIYGHLDAYSVKDGQTVKTGDVIGKVGTTGRSTGYHLHFGWKVTGAANPGYLDYQNPVIGRNIGDALLAAGVAA